jgi:uncharacterized membrane protein
MTHVKSLVAARIVLLLAVVALVALSFAPGLSAETRSAIGVGLVITLVFNLALYTIPAPRPE